MSKVGSMTNAVNKVLGTFKGVGGYGNSAMKGAAIGGGLGAAYGGISDNHTALGMGLAGATLGFGGGREYAGLKAWQGALSKGRQISSIGPVTQGRSPIMMNGSIKQATGTDGAWSYAKHRFNNLGG